MITPCPAVTANSAASMLPSAGVLEVATETKCSVLCAEKLSNLPQEKRAVRTSGEVAALQNELESDRLPCNHSNGGVREQTCTHNIMQASKTGEGTEKEEQVRVWPETSCCPTGYEAWDPVTEVDNVNDTKPHPNSSTQAQRCCANKHTQCFPTTLQHVAAGVRLSDEDQQELKGTLTAKWSQC